MYFGEKTLTTLRDGHEIVRDVLIYRDYEIERVARFAFALARMRRKRLTSVDKNNVLLQAPNSGAASLSTSLKTSPT